MGEDHLTQELQKWKKDVIVFLKETEENRGGGGFERNWQMESGDGMGF